MTTIITRAGKGSQLTHTEQDVNTVNLNTDKAEVSALTAHTTDTGNPHAVTPAQVGSPPNARLINTTTPLQGGGDLSGDRTLTINNASEGGRGSIELATQAEVDAGTDANRAVTPATLAAAPASAATLGVAIAMSIALGGD